MVVLRVAVAVVGMLVVVWLAAVALRSKRRLDRRVAEFLRKQEEGSAPVDPYAAIAELYAEDARKSTPSQQARKSRG